MNQIFHILSRGVDKRKIFMENEDYLRFVHNLFEFNDKENVINNLYFFQQQQSKSMGLRNPYIRENLVDILAFCLMSNHYHLLLAPKTEDAKDAVSKFMKKVNGGYANYFNGKYQRKGALFEGRYKSIQVKNEAHFIHLPYYIHLNPLDLVMPGWRQGKIEDYKKADRFLGSYRWSSHLDYSGVKNFPSVTNRELLTEFFSGPQEYKNSLNKWMRERHLNTIQNYLLE